MRVRGGHAPRKSKNRVFKEAKGFWGGRRKLWKTVLQVVRRSHQEAFKGRKLRKRDMRYLWITRINAAVRARGMSYSIFMGKLAKSGVALDRKSLADIAVRDSKGFDAIFAQVTKG
jgi:large subunit ribosomal protein L20